MEFNPIYLYADPGAGALLLQILMAALFGGLFFFRRIKDKVLGIFGKKTASTTEISSSETNTAESSGITRE